MPEIVESDVIAGVYQVTPTLHGDERGLFIETYRREWFPGGREMVQANRGNRRQGSVVGLHYHLHQADYWYVPVGTARVVLHDLREGGPTDGATLALDLSGDNHCGVFIPPGVAHGFAAVTDMVITYLVDGYYNPADELGLMWNDPPSPPTGASPTRSCRPATKPTLGATRSPPAAGPTGRCAPTRPEEIR